MLDLVISIVNHNSVVPLHDCLERILPGLDRLNCEVYVVDNLCSERAVPMLKEAFPQVNVITNTSTREKNNPHNTRRSACKTIVCATVKRSMAPVW